MSQESNNTRTLIAIDEVITQDIVAALHAVKNELALSRKREELLRKELERSRLLTEKEAQAYLSRDAETLRYYRMLGLESIKKGQSRWYVKGVIDDWLESGRVNRHKSK